MRAKRRESLGGACDSFSTSTMPLGDRNKQPNICLSPKMQMGGCGLATWLQNPRSARLIWVKCVWQGRPRQRAGRSSLKYRRDEKESGDIANSCNLAAFPPPGVCFFFSPPSSSVNMGAASLVALGCLSRRVATGDKQKVPVPTHWRGCGWCNCKVHAGEGDSSITAGEVVMFDAKTSGDAGTHQGLRPPALVSKGVVQLELSVVLEHAGMGLPVPVPVPVIRGCACCPHCLN